MTGLYTTVILVFFILCTACNNQQAVHRILSPTIPTKTNTVFLDAPVLAEASGMAISRRDKELLWMHNDSGAEPVLWAVTTGGHVRGKLNIIGAEAIDWEDMASFVWLGKPYLLVADTGDNRKRRDSLTLYIIAEPDLASADKFEFSTAVEWQITVSFADGATDIEAVAVDMVSQTIILISKQNDPADIYQISLHNRVAYDVTPVGVINALPVHAATSKKRNRITALDIFPSMDDGKQPVLLLTNAYSYVFMRESRQPWHKVFSTAPIALLNNNDLRKAESAAFSWQKSKLYIGSEKSPYSLREIQLSY